MLVLNCNAQDTGGQCYRLKEAFEAHSKQWEMRNLLVTQDYMQWPPDILWDTRDQQYTDALFKSADLVHVHNKYRYWSRWNEPLRKDLPILMHQHGRWPCGPAVLAKSDRRLKAYRVVSTLNLHTFVEDDSTRWLPSPIDANRLQSMVNKPQDGKIRICHAPTNRELKDTDFFLDVMKKLQSKHPEVELVLLENMTNAQVLEVKAKCDILYDQLLLWYGNNAIESWSMGQPVVVGMGESTRQLSKQHFGNEPWAFADKDTLYTVLEDLVVDAGHRKKMGDLGRAHVMKYHHYPACVKVTQEVYKKAIQHFNS